jgi:3-deoxy-manno-octulosonate cytidylyltransferase (CMP-KDO synthetase)
MDPEVKMSQIIGVIPARYASTRFPGKPLALIAGKPLLQWVIEGSKKSKLIQKILVATDDERIADLAKKCGVEPIMTPSELPTGTDRIWYALKKYDQQNQKFDIAINIQGDEPLIQAEILDALAKDMIDHPECEMGTLAHPFKNAEDIANPNTAKIVLNHKNEAIYFSRFPIPHSRVLAEKGKEQSVSLQHIGIYAYRKNFLQKFCETPAQPLEIHEGLEQLRALYLGAKIKVVTVGYETRGVDTPEDVIKVEKLLSSRRSS